MWWMDEPLFFDDFDFTYLSKKKKKYFRVRILLTLKTLVQQD